MLAFAGDIPEEELFDPAVLAETKVAFLGCYAGPVEEGGRALAPLRELAEPLADVSGPTPYAELQSLLDADYPDGMRYYWKSLYLDGLPDDAIERIERWADAAPSPLSTVDVWQLGGAMDDVPEGGSAFAGRGAPYLLGVEANWEEDDPDVDAANVEWVRDCLDDMRAFSDGTVYLNFPGFLGEDRGMVRRTFGDDYERLVAVKNEYDPTNLFRLNQNVKPTV